MLCSGTSHSSNAKSNFLIFQSRRPLSSFTPNQREGIMSLFTVLFRTLDFTCTFLFHFYFALFHFVHLYIFTFYISTLPFYSYFYKRKTTPKKGRDIIPDIFDPIHQPDPTLMNRAFWRQNTRIHFTFNKPAPFGAKLSGAFHWNCSTPFYSRSVSLIRISLFCCVFKLMFLIK
jgi:hypothetical protein